MTRLLDEIDVLETSGDPAEVEVRGIAHDSRLVQDGDLFCCLPGRISDGHDHAQEAVRRGAVALVCERAVPVSLVGGVPQVVVEPGTARPAMARIAAEFWSHPARDLTIVGVTGTNGKTTVAHLVGAVLDHAGRPTTVLGTLSGARTTPEAPELQRTLAGLRPARPGPPRPAVAMEVSSHALAQARVEGIRFDVAVFTNLSHDHLDFHGTMEDYFAAKASLFEPGRAEHGVVDADDPWGRRLLEAARIPMTAVRLAEASDVRPEVGRSRFTWRGERITLHMTGAVNVRNAVLAAEACVALGLEPAEVAVGLSAAPPVPGRLELVASRAGGASARCAVLVDYAHTPAGLETVLAEARRLARGKVIVVFGCGGERDRAKRPLMGALAAAMADLAVLTSDNPRHEDPAAIIAEVRAGASGAHRLLVEPDRRAAITMALQSAGEGDVVVVAGKGHEAFQEIGDERIPFDDRAVVTEVLEGRLPAETTGG